MNEEYTNMKDIARHFRNATSHTVGRELRDAGYRGEDRKPTPKAFGERFAIAKRDPEHPTWIAYLWSTTKVGQLLEDFGWVRVSDDE